MPGSTGALSNPSNNLRRKNAGLERSVIQSYRPDLGFACRYGWPRVLDQSAPISNAESHEFKRRPPRLLFTKEEAGAQRREGICPSSQKSPWLELRNSHSQENVAPISVTSGVNWDETDICVYLPPPSSPGWRGWLLSLPQIPVLTAFLACAWARYLPLPWEGRRAESSQGGWRTQRSGSSSHWADLGHQGLEEVLCLT